MATSAQPYNFKCPNSCLRSRIRGRPTGAGTSKLTALHRMRDAVSRQGTRPAYPLRGGVAGHAVASGMIQWRRLIRYRPEADKGSVINDSIMSRHKSILGSNSVLRWIVLTPIEPAGS